MFRHFPGRNQRSKNNKIKLGLQFCFLVVVCLWLMYQVKHSYDKKKEFDAKSGLTTIKIATDDTKLGRKDLKPKTKETVTTNEDVNDEQDDETAAEEEMNKLEDEEEQDIKSEKKYDAKVDREEDLMEDEENVLRENIGVDTKGRARHANTTGPLEIEESSAHENAISGIETKEEIEITTFGDVTGLRTNFLNQTMDTDDKTAMIEDSPSKTEIADEIQQDHKRAFLILQVV